MKATLSPNVKEIKHDPSNVQELQKSTELTN